MPNHVYLVSACPEGVRACGQFLVRLLQRGGRTTRTYERRSINEFSTEDYGQHARVGCVHRDRGERAEPVGRRNLHRDGGGEAAGGASTTAPVTITIDRKMSESEADTVRAAFTKGGAAGLRKALVGVAPTGSIQLGSGKPTPTRLTIERPTDKGRLLTVVTDRPILFLGAGIPGAKPKDGYDFAVLDIEVDAKGTGSGTLSPAAKVGLKQGAFVVETTPPSLSDSAASRR